MSKIRVYQLARELGLSKQEVIERLVKAMARVALSREEISKKKGEAPTEPPPEPERPHVDVRRPETPVIEEPAPVREDPAPVAANPAAPNIPALTTPPTVEEPVIPSAPTVVTIPEMITVKELSEKLATTRGEIIKTLMKMRIAATGNQNLNPELVKHVAVEFGFHVEVTPYEEVVEEVEEFVGEVDDPIKLTPPEPVPGVQPERKPLPVEENLPTAKMVKISEMVTLKELSKKVETGPSEIIKTLMKMGITATLDQNLNPEMVKQLAVEFGFNVQVTPFEEVEQHSGASRVGLAGTPWLELSAAMRARGAHISEVGLPSIDTTSHATGSTASSYVLRNKLWFLGGAIVTMVLLTLAVPRVKGTRSPEATPPVVDEGQRIAAISFTKASSSTLGDPRTYRKDIKPLIGVYCHKCHGLKGVAAGIPLETYRDVIEYVEPGGSEKSRLYTFIQQRKNHVNPWPRSWGHTTNDKLAVIKHWIDVDWAEE